MNVCLSPKERLQRVGRYKTISRQSVCHNGDFTAKQDSKLKQEIQIERLKDALKQKGD